MNPENYKPFDVPVPWRLKRRPVHRGFPVPYLVIWADGVPDFRVSDHPKWLEVTQKKLCGLCGMKLDMWKYLIGGAKSIKERLFYDPPSHLECAMYSLRVCPYLAMVRGYSFRAVNAPDMLIKKVHAVSTEPVSVIGMIQCSSYRVTQYGNDQLIEAGRPRAITWYKDGEEIAMPSEQFVQK